MPARFRARLYELRPGVLGIVIVAAALLLLAGTLALPARPALADEGWVITSFDATYRVRTDGTVEVSEDIRVDFGSLQKHGILRNIPVHYQYDEKHVREIDIDVSGVTDGSRSVRYALEGSDSTEVIRIGDPDELVSGPQRYVISYTMRGALNPFDDHDELYVNITGNEWDVPIEKAMARVTAPDIQQITCFQGLRESTEQCGAGPSGSDAVFIATRPLAPGSGLTVVVSVRKGAVNVPPPRLIEIKNEWEQLRDFLGLSPLPIAAALMAGAGMFYGLGRLWWTKGRDRTYGDVQYLTGSTEETTRPIFARETVVTEFEPPQLSPGRYLRPAEIGVLMDEGADTLDVTATIVDLAVRGYLRIVDAGDKDWELQRLREPDATLLPYESRLLKALFEQDSLSRATGTVKLKELKNKFYDDLAKVKGDLYDVVGKRGHLFAGNPETVRNMYRVAGGVATAVGGLLVFGLGALGAGIIAVPLVITGLFLLIFAGVMPRRTASGRELYRRSQGFKEYMTTAETDRARFAEEVNRFDAYLPYAIVFKCTEQWAKRFEGLESQRASTTGGWYVSPYPFRAAAFASSINSFSSSVNSAIASTPSGSGSSGFSSGGFSGGGVGGGGGSSW